MIFSQTIGAIRTEEQFNQWALKAFRYQLVHNRVYRTFVDALGRTVEGIDRYTAIPCLPVELFKTNRVYASPKDPEVTFRSSGTTGMQRSIHEVADASLYRSALLGSFRHFYGEPSGYLLCALTPSRREHPESSLAFMIDTLIRTGTQPGSGFYQNDPERLQKILLNRNTGYRIRDTGAQIPYPVPRILLIGLTYALLDLAEQHPVLLDGAVIMETGGMKGQREELVREEVHSRLKEAFGVPTVHSEYGMSELLSQAYSSDAGLFRTPPWMKALIRDPNDPLTWLSPGRTGGISVIDLANWYSCPFIATQDLGRMHEDGSFEVLGRFDESELRGCNLMGSD